MAKTKKASRPPGSHASVSPSRAHSDEAMMNRYIEVAPDAVVVCDAHGQILFVNRQTEILFGYPRATLQGEPIEILLPERFRSNHLGNRDGYIKSPRTRPMGMGLDLWAQRQDGTEFPVEISLSPLETDMGLRIVSIVRDISERRQLEAAVQRSEREAAIRAQEAEQRLVLLRSILDELPSAVFLVEGHDGCMVLANAATKQVWGADWSVGKPMMEFLQEHSIQIFGNDGRELNEGDLATLRVLRTAEPVRQHQEVIRHPDNSSLPILMHVLPLPVGSLHSLSHHAQADEQAAALVMAHDVTVLKESEHLKDEFIGIAAHELRNPLAAIRGFADMLRVQTARGRGPKLAEWQTEAIEAIDQSAERLAELTDDLLDVTHLQAGKLDLHLATSDLVALTQRMITRHQATTARHELVLHTEPSPIAVYVDVIRIEEVIGNLLHNSIKYSLDGGTILVQIQRDENAKEVILSVQDFGIGIPEHDKARIFGRFARADNARSIGGTGLGLYLCRALIERHYGRIWFDSNEEQGSTFFVTLPLADEPAL